MYRAYKNRSDSHVSVIVFILVAVTVWAHRTIITRIEHLLPVIWASMAVIVGLVLITELSLKLSKIRHLHRTNTVNIDNMTGLEFEEYVAGLLRSQGYINIRLTEKYDLGIDIIAEKDNVCWGIQVKRYSGLVKADAVRQVVTALNYYNCDKAMVITNSRLSKVARELAESNNCVLIERNILMKWSI